MPGCSQTRRSDIGAFVVHFAVKVYIDVIVRYFSRAVGLLPG